MDASPSPPAAEFDLESYDYPFEESRVAAYPAPQREASRLLVFRRAEEEVEETTFAQIGRFLRPGDLLVVNRSLAEKVRLRLKRRSGGAIEILLFNGAPREEGEGCRLPCLLRGGAKLKAGEVLSGDGFTLTLAERPQQGRGEVHLAVAPRALPAFLETFGQVPLPPYILKRRRETHLTYGDDPQRYRTVFADTPGGIAAPTAGFHFSEALLAELAARGIGLAKVHLQVGSDTFLPIRERDIRRHQVQSEAFDVSEEAAAAIEAAQRRGGRVIAVGTTAVRALESAAQEGAVRPCRGLTSLTILPGHRFQAVDGLITNFHMPRSSLLVLVASFAGRERLLALYRRAMAAGFRFYSYGDAMLIL